MAIPNFSGPGPTVQSWPASTRKWTRLIPRTGAEIGLMRKDLGDHLLEITRRTEALAGRSVGSAIAGDEISRLRISVPLVRRAVKHGYAFVSDSPSKNLVVWDYIWRHSACYEVMHQALYFYQHRQSIEISMSWMFEKRTRSESITALDRPGSVLAPVTSNRPRFTAASCNDPNPLTNSRPSARSM